GGIELLELVERREKARRRRLVVAKHQAAVVRRMIMLVQESLHVEDVLARIKQVAKTRIGEVLHAHQQSKATWLESLGHFILGKLKLLNLPGHACCRVVDA